MPCKINALHLHDKFMFNLLNQLVMATKANNKVSTSAVMREIREYEGTLSQCIKRLQEYASLSECKSLPAYLTQIGSSVAEVATLKPATLIKSWTCKSVDGKQCLKCKTLKNADGNIYGYVFLPVARWTVANVLRMIANSHKKELATNTYQVSKMADGWPVDIYYKRVNGKYELQAIGAPKDEPKDEE